MRRSRAGGAPLALARDWSSGDIPRHQTVPLATTNPFRAASIDFATWKLAMTLEHTLARGTGHDISAAWLAPQVSERVLGSARRVIANAVPA